jgi:hypothetical protein
MNFGVGTVFSEIHGNRIELVFKAIHSFIDSVFHPVDLFRKHLVAFDYQIKLVLNGISEGTNMAGDHAVDLFKIVFVHFLPPKKSGKTGKKTGDIIPILGARVKG